MKTKSIPVEDFQEELLLNLKESDIKSLKDFEEALTSDDPKKMEGLPEKFKNLSPELQQSVMNATKQYNRTLILEAIKNLSETHRRIPSVLEIASHVKLSDTTVYKHLKELNEQGHREEVMLQFNTQFSQYLSVIANAATNDPKAAKMALDILLSYKSSTAPVNNPNTNNPK